MKMMQKTSALYLSTDNKLPIFSYK